MRVLPTQLAGLCLLEPRILRDERGFFFESYQQHTFAETTGSNVQFVQDNHSRSRQGVLRGLHYQVGTTQGKLVRVTRGEVFDVAVDLRRSSPTFGQWEGTYLNARQHRQLWIPAGFAHGFLVLSHEADVLYKTDGFYAPGAERSIHFADPDLDITWPTLPPGCDLLVSTKDQQAGSFAGADYFA